MERMNELILVIFSGTEYKLRDLYMLGKGSTTNSHSQPHIDNF